MMIEEMTLEDVRNEFPDYIIKFASDNPRNPANQAGPEELKVIEYLNNNPQSQRWEGNISINAKPYFAKFSAMRVEERCLRCHGNPDDAPAVLLKRYGSTAGFHHPLGKVIGLDTIAIPMAKISEKLWPELLKTFLVSALGLLLFFLFIVSTTKLLITNRLTMISRHFVISAQQSDYLQIKPLEIKGKDEICDLAVSFNTLADKLKHFYASLEMQVKERTSELENANVQLRQEIDERKRAEAEREELIRELQGALARVKQLSGLLPICASCKKIRDDKGYWTQIEAYVRDRSEAEFSHGICPECEEKLYPECSEEGHTQGSNEHE
jgi:methyl-accepting chemotaxis protein